MFTINNKIFSIFRDSGILDYVNVNERRGFVADLIDSNDELCLEKTFKKYSLDSIYNVKQLRNKACIKTPKKTYVVNVRDNKLDWYSFMMGE